MILLIRRAPGSTLFPYAPLFRPLDTVRDPGSESLNAAVATAVTVAEFRRRNIMKGRF